jgi:hypothetical protein
MQQSVGRWHGLGGRTGRTRRRALAASGADFRADLDVVAIRRNRAGRAKIETAVAAGDVFARMGAELRAVKLMYFGLSKVPTRSRALSTARSIAEGSRGSARR